jgi:hypothetical protein
MEHSMKLRPLLLTAVLSVTTVALADSTFDKTLNVSGQSQPVRATYTSRQAVADRFTLWDMYTRDGVRSEM